MSHVSRPIDLLSKILANWLLVVTLLPATQILCSSYNEQQQQFTNITAITNGANSTATHLNNSTTLENTTNNSTTNLGIQSTRPNSNQEQQQQQQDSNNQAANQQHEPPRRQQPPEDEYLVGVGIADITGPAADINLVSLLQQLLVVSPPTSSASAIPPRTYGSGGGGSTSIANNVLQLQYPSWQEFRNVKMQFRINFRSLLLQTSPLMNVIFRWAMPNQIKMQAEYTYANFVVQL